VVQCIIFDLSEVLISGLLGIEQALSRELHAPAQEILCRFEGRAFEQLLLGSLSEDAYLGHVIARGKWPIDVTTLKGVIRCNFHNTIAGTIEILMELARNHELALLSDHAREWVSYIRAIHPFLGVFHHTFFSFDLKGLKRDPSTFAKVLAAISIPTGRCLFIDDNPLNIAAAESVGISSIRFENAAQLAVELGALLSRD
jgi:beta-phosphoglucomutase-like phosphatase (HAD superfamily)